MSAKSETLYLKIDQNTIVTDRHVTLGDIAKMECPDASIVRQLKQKKIYTFAEAMNPRKQKNQMKVFSILKIVELIHEEYPNVDISNEGEKDFIIEYIPNPEKPKWINASRSAWSFFSGRRSRLWRSTTMYPWEMSFPNSIGR